MKKTQQVQDRYCFAKLALQRKKKKSPATEIADERLEKEMQEIRSSLEALDKEISPLAQMDAELSNKTWGLLMRAGNDKSYDSPKKRKRGRPLKDPGSSSVSEVCSGVCV